MFSRTMCLCAVTLMLANRSAIGQQAAATRLDLDARQASIGLLHAHLIIPAVPGPLTVAYPKWIPGEQRAQRPPRSNGSAQVRRQRKNARLAPG